MFRGLAGNCHVETVSLANCDITDTVGAMIGDCLEQNRSLKFLTLDSNSLGGDMIVSLIAATSKTQALEELRVSNQARKIDVYFCANLICDRQLQLNCKYLGNRIENEIVDAVEKAPQLVKLGITLEFRDSLNKTAVTLLNNLDRSIGMRCR